MPARALLPMLLVAALLAAAPAHAATWTPLTSGTSAEITAIEYQGGTRFWFTTNGGAIHKRLADGSFEVKRLANGLRLNDIEFEPTGNLGFAVGDGGTVLRSVNGGDSWTDVNPLGNRIPASKQSSTFPDCTVNENLGNVNTVRFAGAGRVWIMAAGSQLARSSNPDDLGGVGKWVDANRSPTNTCRIRSDRIYATGHADAFFVQSNPNLGYITSGYFGVMFRTTDNLASDATELPADAANAVGLRRRLAGDQANPTRMWAINPAPYGRSTTAYTDDAWASARVWEIANDTKRSFPTNGPFDVDFAGGTVLAAGDAGMILNSRDGANFYYVDGTGSLATQNWRAVSLASASAAAIGGTGGRLAVSSNANVLPDIVPPTGLIVGPDTVAKGVPVRFTAQVADNAGGSGIDPAGFSWTSEGLPGASGQSPAFTFPNDGYYTLRVRFRDRAGNTAEATKGVTVGKPPQATFPTDGGSVPTAKRKGGKVRLRVKGRLAVPPGASCGGKIRIAVKKAKKPKKVIARSSVTVKDDCRYSKRMRIKRRKVGSAKKLRVVLVFVPDDSSTVAKTRISYTTRVR